MCWQVFGAMLDTEVERTEGRRRRFSVEERLFKSPISGLSGNPAGRESGRVRAVAKAKSHTPKSVCLLPKHPDISHSSNTSLPRVPSEQFGYVDEGEVERRPFGGSGRQAAGSRVGRWTGPEVHHQAVSPRLSGSRGIMVATWETQGLMASARKTSDSSYEEAWSRHRFRPLDDVTGLHVTALELMLAKMRMQIPDDAQRARGLSVRPQKKRQEMLGGIPELGDRWKVPVKMEMSAAG
ncbi:hypothetical protein MAPG_09001 [Magnaporthiopsis poae ATCC 64411]|uniref:Uncharacterized protein n=1 Tax=Magnaporthiopsis poae (strain ATCC 64411 / 73-15) TaxID=644358 RepID=A0A0C4E8T2_MAGP6|nr:hypothetical protein MAPG_09001 [Magnaporthiopsis poae ATCC 64411]